MFPLLCAVLRPKEGGIFYGWKEDRKAAADLCSGACDGTVPAAAQRTGAQLSIRVRARAPVAALYVRGIRALNACSGYEKPPARSAFTADKIRPAARRA